jgi:hypothetical protein
LFVGGGVFLESYTFKKSDEQSIQHLFSIRSRIRQAKVAWCRKNIVKKGKIKFKDGHSSLEKECFFCKVNKSTINNSCWSFEKREEEFLRLFLSLGGQYPSNNFKRDFEAFLRIYFSSNQK